MIQKKFSKFLDTVTNKRSKSKQRNSPNSEAADNEASGRPSSNSAMSSRSNLEQARSAGGKSQGSTLKDEINAASGSVRAVTPSMGPNEPVTVEQPTETTSRPLGQRVRDGAIIFLDLTSKISEATDLLKPLKAVSEVLKKTLEIARDVNNVNDDWEILTKRLKFHLATVECQESQLEEDEKIAQGSTPPPNSKIKELLTEYASQLGTVHQLLSENAPMESSIIGKVVDVEHNKGLITQKSQELEDSFTRYTTSLQTLIASTVVQLKDNIHQVHLDVLKEAAKSHLDRLKASDVYGNQHRLCLQGTRTKTLEAIRQWVNPETDQRWMFCLLDVAGSGKSTVAKHMAEEWKKQGKIVARFFFSRDTSSTMSTNLFCSTVSKLFADRSEAFEKAAKNFKDYGDLTFEERFEGLITRPLQASKEPTILTIDALDECNNETGERDELLQTLVEQLPSVPNLRVLVTGRPEKDIKQWAQSSVGYTNFSKLEGDDKDVKLYIENRLQNLSLADRSRIYPVIRRAEGLFIWARIACDLIEKTADVDELLNTLGQDITLDYLYRIALEQSIPKDSATLKAIVTILQMILAAKRPLSIAELEKLAPKPTIVEGVVSLLGSFLLYRDREDPIRLLHATFREYITDSRKSGVLFVQVELGHHLLAVGCIGILAQNSNLDMDLYAKDTVSKTSFIYSSNSWVHHCTSSNRKLGLNEQVLTFARNGLTEWMRQVKKWWELDLETSTRGLMDLSRRGMSPIITRTLVEWCIKWLEMEITLVEKAERERFVEQGKYYLEGPFFRFKYIWKRKLLEPEGEGDDIPPYEELKKQFEELAVTLPQT